MNEFTIYFELCGKKMKTKIFANTEQSAKEKLYDKIIFHKIDYKKISNPIEDLLNGHNI